MLLSHLGYSPLLADVGSLVTVSSQLNRWPRPEAGGRGPGYGVHVCDSGKPAKGLGCAGDTGCAPEREPRLWVLACALLTPRSCVGSARSCRVLSGSGWRLLFFPPPPAAPLLPAIGQVHSYCFHAGFLLERALWPKGGQRTPGLGGLHACAFEGEQTLPLGFPAEERCTREAGQGRGCAARPRATRPQDPACSLAQSRGAERKCGQGPRRPEDPASGVEHRALVTSQPLHLPHLSRALVFPPVLSQPALISRVPVQIPERPIISVPTSLTCGCRHGVRNRPAPGTGAFRALPLNRHCRRQWGAWALGLPCLWGEQASDWPCLRSRPI